MDNKLFSQLTTTQSEIAKVEAEIMKKTAALQKTLVSLKEKDTQVRSAIKEAMIKNNVKKFENDLMTITLVEESTRKTLDSKLLKEEAPGIYDKYVKETKVAASVRIKIKES